MSKRRRELKRQHPDKPVVKDYQLQERELSLLHLINKYPNYIIRGLAHRGEAEWHYGRLYLVGVINKQQYAAACHIDKVTRSWRRMVKRYGHIQANTYQQISSSYSHEDLSEAVIKKCKRIQKDYNDVYGALSECGEDIKEAIVDALEKNTDTDIELIRRGLTVVAAYVK